MIANDGRPDRAADWYPTLAALDAHRKQMWEAGQRLAIFSTTKIEAERIAADLKKERPAAKVVPHHVRHVCRVQGVPERPRWLDCQEQAPMRSRLLPVTRDGR